MNKVKFLRLHRPNTDSWITYELKQRVQFFVGVALMDKKMPGWEVMSGSATNPDEEENYETV